MLTRGVANTARAAAAAIKQAQSGVAKQAVKIRAVNSVTDLPATQGSSSSVPPNNSLIAARQNLRPVSDSIPRVLSRFSQEKASPFQSHPSGITAPSVKGELFAKNPFLPEVKGRLGANSGLQALVTQRASTSVFVPTQNTAAQELVNIADVLTVEINEALENNDPARAEQLNSDLLEIEAEIAELNQNQASTLSPAENTAELIIDIAVKILDLENQVSDLGFIIFESKKKKADVSNLETKLLSLNEEIEALKQTKAKLETQRASEFFIDIKNTAHSVNALLQNMLHDDLVSVESIAAQIARSRDFLFDLRNISKTEVALSLPKVEKVSINALYKSIENLVAALEGKIMTKQTSSTSATSMEKPATEAISSTSLEAEYAELKTKLQQTLASFDVQNSSAVNEQIVLKAEEIKEKLARLMQEIDTAKENEELAELNANLATSTNIKPKDSTKAKDTNSSAEKVGKKKISFAPDVEEKQYLKHHSSSSLSDSINKKLNDDE